MSHLMLPHDRPLSPLLPRGSRAVHTPRPPPLPPPCADNQGQVAPLFYPEVLALTKDLGKYGDFFLGYDNTTGKVTQNSTTFCAQMGIQPDTPATENCLSYCTDPKDLEL